jgi:hypothetical protein
VHVIVFKKKTYYFYFKATAEASDNVIRIVSNDNKQMSSVIYIKKRNLDLEGGWKLFEKGNSLFFYASNHVFHIDLTQQCVINE